MTTVYSPRFVALALGLGLLTGCGTSGSKADVSGTIKLRGQTPKLAGLEIVFLSSDGSQVSAPIAEDGTYKAVGVPPGEAKIYFSSVSREAAQEGANVKKGGPRLQKPDGASAPPPVPVAGNFPKANPIREDLRTASTSKLSVKVESGKNNVFDYDLP